MNSITHSATPTRSLAGSIAIIGALFFIMGFFTWINGPLIGFVQLAFELSEVSAFLVVFVFYISYFVFALPASWVLRKIGMKKGLALALLVITAGAALFGERERRPLLHPRSKPQSGSIVKSGRSGAVSESYQSQKLV